MGGDAPPPTARGFSLCSPVELTCLSLAMGEELETLAFGCGPHLLESKYPAGAGPGVLLGTPLPLCCLPGWAR